MSGKLFFVSLVVTFLFVAMAVSNFAQPTEKKDCKPKISMSSLLNNLEVNSNLRIGTLYATCLPMPEKKSRSAYQYDPYEGGKLSTVLKDKDGKVINTFVWYARLSTSLWEMSRYEIEGGAGNLKNLAPGKYVLEFAVEDKVFQSLSFSVSTADSTDKFNPQKLYLLDGDWKDYALLYSPKLDRFIKLGVWLRDPANLSDKQPTLVTTKTRLIREKDKMVMAEDEVKYALNHKWRAIDLSFRKPVEQGKTDYSEFKLSEVTANDGKYKIELLLDGKLYATYKFDVKGGEINGIDLVKMQKEAYSIRIDLTAELITK